MRDIDMEESGVISGKRQLPLTIDLLKVLFSVIVWLVVCPIMGQTDSKVRGHMEGERLIMTLNENILGRPMLFVRHGSSNQYQVRWSKKADYLVLEAPPVHSLVGVLIPQGVNGTSSILGRFPILPNGRDIGSFQVDVTDFILQAPISWQNIRPEAVDRQRSYIDGVYNLNKEVAISTKRTLLKKDEHISTAVDFSFFELPKPMKPRLFDHRMGFFSEDIFDVLNHSTKPALASIMRWRLEKKDKAQKLSEPVKPIVFYLDRDIPEKWKPYITAGIMEWQPAFEAAGFKDALIVREFSSKDSLWTLNTMGHSVIRWNMDEGTRKELRSSSTVHQITDFRTGEILKADIIIGGTFDYWVDQYFIRCAPLDARARQYPVPDSLKGELLQYITAHEAGHAFGLKDANYGEYAYPFGKMRDKDWLKKMGHTPSIMGYARHNYVVQPEDGIPPSLLIQKVGPMDRYHIQWGYQEIQDVQMPTDELPVLEYLIRQQDSVQWYRYNLNQYERIGPGAANNVMDNDNPVESTRLGLKNLERVIETLDEMYHSGNIERYVLRSRYNATLELWYAEMQHVLSMVGGYSIQYRSKGQKGPMYSPIDRVDQEEALSFFIEQTISPPDWLANPDFLTGLRFSSHPDASLGYQQKLIQKLFGPHRMKRLEWMEGALGYKGLTEYVLTEFQTELFCTMDMENHRRQGLQKGFIALLVKVVQEEMDDSAKLGNFGYSEQTKGLFMNAITTLKTDVQLAMDDNLGQNNIGHLRHCLLQMAPVFP
ncbi:MAG: zinc-dependent metalloprotease [Flavobacteriaceae bacterium]|nr:zinc-dependent metalloprotease [Flavobacteriaceae bacterium]